MSPAPTREAQLTVVRQVAAAFWGLPADDLGDLLDGIRVMNPYHGGKVMGALPPFAGRPEAFFKVYFYDRGFHFETQGLRAANAMHPMRGISVPKLIAVMPEYRAILTEHKNWEGNRSPIQRFFVGSLRIDWERVGRWLRAFHDAQRPQPPNMAFMRYKTAKIESHLRDLVDLFTPVQTERMRQIIDGAQAAFQREDGDWVLSHGDFGLSNIQASDARRDMDIIDFEDCQVAPRCFDLLNCLVRLDYLHYFPQLPGAYCSVERAFMTGYGMPLPHSPTAAFFELLIRLDVLESYERRIASSPISKRCVYQYFLRFGLDALNKWLF